jgi:hypothetical protein
MIKERMVWILLARRYLSRSRRASWPRGNRELDFHDERINGRLSLLLLKDTNP